MTFIGILGIMFASSYIPTVQVLPLPNTWLITNKDTNVVSIALGFKDAGNKVDTIPGISDLLGAMLDEGSAGKDSQAFKEFLLQHNINLSINVNEDNLVIILRCCREKLDVAWRVLHDVLLKPSFDAKALQKVKGYLQANYKEQSESEIKIAANALAKFLFKDHPYARSPKELLANVSKIDAKHLRNFLHDNISQQNFNLSVVGNITKEELLKGIEGTFKKLPAKLNTKPIPTVKWHNQGQLKHIKLDIPQSVIFFAQPGIRRDDPKFYAAYALNKLLGDGNFESRLWNSVREKYGLAYNIDTDIIFSDQRWMIAGSTATQYSQTERTVNLIREIWKVNPDSITQKELDHVKNRMINAYSHGFSSTKTIATMLLSYQLSGLGPEYVAERNIIVEKITLQQVRDIASELIKPLTFVVVGR